MNSIRTAGLCLPLLVLALVSTACRDTASEPEPSPPLATVTPTPPPPSKEEMENATYKGLPNTAGEIILENGKWERETFRAGDWIRNVVFLVPNSRVVGQLNASDSQEGVAILAGRGAGTGELLSLAVIERVDGALRNTGTALIGDRTQIRDMRIEDRQILLDLVQAGPEDSLCCPGELVRRSWELDGGILRESRPPTDFGRLTPESITGRQWVLSEWDYLSESAPATPPVTLTFDEGTASGSAGCNQYRASLQARGPLPGQIRVSPPETTDNLCLGDAMFVEERFLEQMAGVNSFSFLMGRLSLSYQAGEAYGTMVFEARPLFASPDGGE